MNLLPIWHTSTSSYHRNKILGKQKGLRVNGEFISKSDVFKHPIYNSPNVCTTSTEETHKYGLLTSPATISSPTFNHQQIQKRKQINRKYKQNTNVGENYNSMLKKLLLNSNHVTVLSASTNQTSLGSRKSSKTTTFIKTVEKQIPIDELNYSQTFISSIGTERYTENSLCSETTFYKYEFNKPLIDYNSTLNLFRKQTLFNYDDYKNINRQADLKNSSASNDLKRLTEFKKSINEFNFPTTKRSQTPEQNQISISNEKNPQTNINFNINNNIGNSTKQRQLANSNPTQDFIALFRENNNNSTISLTNKTKPTPNSQNQNKIVKSNSSNDLNDNQQGPTSANASAVLSQRNNNLFNANPKQACANREDSFLPSSRDQRNTQSGDNSALQSAATTIQRQNTHYLKFLSKPSLNNFSSSFLNGKQTQCQSNNNVSTSTYACMMKFDKSTSNLTANNNEAEPNVPNHEESSSNPTSCNQVISVKGIQPASRFFNGHLTPLGSTPVQPNNPNNINSININNSNIINSNNTYINLNANNNSSIANSNMTNANSVTTSLQLTKNESNLIKRKLSKSMGITNSAQTNSQNTTNSNNMNTNNSNLFINNVGNYYNNGNNTHFSSNNSNNQTTSPLKHAPNIPLLQAKKYANEYKNSMRFDYNDPFSMCCQDFLQRISEMHRLQMDTIEYERKKKLNKKKSKINTNNNNNANNIYYND